MWIESLWLEKYVVAYIVFSCEEAALEGQKEVCVSVCPQN